MKRFPEYNLAYHGSWTYVHGYTLFGFDMLYRATGNRRYYDFIKRYVDKHIDENGDFRQVIDGRGRLRDTAFDNQDNMMTGNTLVMLYEYTGDERYTKAATTVRRALNAKEAVAGIIWATAIVERPVEVLGPSGAFADRQLNDAIRWKTLPADSTVDEVVRIFFIRQPVLWID